MPDALAVSLNGKTLTVPIGTTVAAVVFIAGQSSFRRSVSGRPRGPLCGMGVCFECRVTVDGVRHVKSCQTLCKQGMQIDTDE
ncbi:MAG TPA: (2Fe-2S)-binding protein [Candidatus Sulfotelmatobacter sp.]|nr:(2Fe-2S)-binding protein [Terriglobales bacterium]HKT90283.1 (2Fe-2S)-binding protein [Candidatus Sulfotelmatobacter sp.]